MSLDAAGTSARATVVWTMEFYILEAGVDGLIDPNG